MSNENQDLEQRKDAPFSGQSNEKNLPSRDFFDSAKSPEEWSGALFKGDSPEWQPNKPDEDGFYTASETDEQFGITTRQYENGSMVKKVVLSTGAVAIVHMLKGRHFLQAQKMTQDMKKENIDFEAVNMSLAVKIDGEQKPPHFFLDDMKQFDFTKIFMAYQGLNFQ